MERARHLVAEFHNILTTAGRTQLLNYLASTGTTTIAFSQYLAIGINATPSVSPADTTLNNEIYRQIPNTTTVTGTQIDIATNVPINSGAGVWTNLGLFGNGATATLGSGTLYTHAIVNYTKVNGTPITIDYVINLT